MEPIARACSTRTGSGPASTLLAAQDGIDIDLVDLLGHQELLGIVAIDLGLDEKIEEVGIDVTVLVS